MTIFYAHTGLQGDQSDWQPLYKHLKRVGRGTARRAAKFGFREAGLLAGLAHDLGKYTIAFARRLNGSSERVDHSTAGAQMVVRLASEQDRFLAEIVAYVIAGHHAGLPDKNASSGSLEGRLKANDLPTLDPVWQREVVLGSPGTGPTGFDWRADRAGFQAAFLGRMIFSCLIDADRRCTEAFGNRVEGRRTAQRVWPALPRILDRLIAAVEAEIAAKQAKSTDLNRRRADILSHVRAKAGASRGLFTLTVPTGGGKTLASIAFALDHAKRHGRHFDRIIYAIPFTSIIDQTAGIFRGLFGDDVVLEHHSAVGFASAAKEEEFGEKGREAKMRMAMEDWAAPLVVTTNVQLFESLFSHRPTTCRKLHNVANSIIVLDEAQAIPLPLLRPCLAALDELQRNYGCTIVLCTATQPAVAEPRFAGGLKLTPERELAFDPEGLHDDLKRVTVRWRPGKTTDADLVAALRDTPQAFVIVNSRKHALALARRATEAGLDGVVHLTTRHYAAHRRRILADVRERLDPKDPRPCLLIATSLIEAGVDLDFPGGWRALSGLQSIVQAAGRVNRENRNPIEDSILTVFDPAEDPPMREIADFIGDLGRIRDKHADITAPRAIEAYFQEVYWRKDRNAALDMIRVPGSGGTVRKSVLDQFRMDPSGTDFSYRTVGEAFRLIESGMVPVIVPAEDAARRALDRLKSQKVTPGSVARDLQPFIVLVPPRARMLLVAAGHVAFVDLVRFGDQFAVLAADSLYREKEGLIWDDDKYLSLEDTIF